MLLFILTLKERPENMSPSRGGQRPTLRDAGENCLFVILEKFQIFHFLKNFSLFTIFVTAKFHIFHHFLAKC